MKRYLSAILAAALLVSATALTACGDNGDTTTSGSTKAPNGSTNPKQTQQGGPSNTTAEQPSNTSGTDAGPSTPSGNEINYRAWTEVENLEAFKTGNTNLMEEQYDSVLPKAVDDNGQDVEGGYCYYTGFDYTDVPDIPEAGTNESAPNIFDGDVNTKWCCPQGEVEIVSALVWSMKEAVNVKGYVMVTGWDSGDWPNRNPTKWRLYGATELPAAKMADIDPNSSDESTYFDNSTVPEGWTLIDAVDAVDPDADGYASLLPNQNGVELGTEVSNPGTYKYFMLLIDEVESGTFQLSDFLLYGSVG